MNNYVGVNEEFHHSNLSVGDKVIEADHSLVQLTFSSKDIIIKDVSDDLLKTTRKRKEYLTLLHHDFIQVAESLCLASQRNKNLVLWLVL